MNDLKNAAESSLEVLQNTENLEVANPISVELQLQQHVERLKQKIPNTRQLYQQLAFDLFTKFEQTPTPKRLYELARKGSMSTVVEELKIFWQNLQQNFQQKITQPDIPQELIYHYKQSIESFWQMATQMAHKNFEQERLIFESNMQILQTQVQNQEMELLEKNQTLTHLETQRIEIAQELANLQDECLIKNKQASAEILKINELLQQQKEQQQKQFNQYQQSIQDLLIKQQNRDEQQQLKLDAIEQQHKEELHHWQKMFDKERIQAKEQTVKFESALHLAQEKRLQLYQEHQDLMNKYQQLHKNWLQIQQQNQANKLEKEDRRLTKSENIALSSHKVFKNRTMPLVHLAAKSSIKKFKKD